MRTSGILMPIFSLPSNYGIGTLGKEAYRFVDFLRKAGQTYWQVLPSGPTGFGDSPYQSFSAYAGNPYFIDLDMLTEDGLLEKELFQNIEFSRSTDRIDYGRLYEKRFKVLRAAFERFRQNIPKDFEIFIKFNSFWLEDYALFMAIKDSKKGESFDKWNDGLKFRVPEYLEQARADLSEDIEFYKMQQYLFWRQWRMLKKYANSNGVKIIGDIPIYVAYDSVDVWKSPELFLLDEKLKPTVIAGCPPDAFSEDGQLWGNPIYDWKVMKRDDYKWWNARIAYLEKMYDFLRIDHFRGFSAYFAIPSGEETAVNGQWHKGPGYDFFEKIEEKNGKLHIIAENLGTLDKPVHELLEKTGFPGMKVLQFAFDPETESDYLPHNIERNCVVYTGTHDNDTAIGYLENAPGQQIDFCREYLRIDENESFNWAMIMAAMATPANTVILQMQDFLGLDNKARINTPSTVQDNWCWRIGGGCTNDWLAEIIYKITALYFRLPKSNEQELPEI